MVSEGEVAESERLIYSASLVLSAVILCWCERQLIAPPLYINIQPVVDFLVSKSAAKSASAYPYIILCPIIPWILFPYVIPCELFPCLKMFQPHRGLLFCIFDLFLI